ncbi:MAG: DNA methyltransferase [Planctomycetota bacterium]
MDTNVLYYGDNLTILRHRTEHGDHDYLPDNSVDLVYLDPPFNSQQAYNILFKENDVSWSPAQVKAFEDTWHWGPETERLYRGIVIDGPPRVAQLLAALIGEPENPGGIGRNDVTAYLVMMTVRLIELHRVLKPTGSLFLHCDPTMSHYIKLILDQIFGPTNFRNEIAWKRSSAHSDIGQGAKHMGRLHDIIFFFSKSEDFTANMQFLPYDESYVESFYRHVEPGTGRHYTLDNLVAPGGAAKGNPRYEFLGITRYWRYSQERMQQLHAEGRIVQTKPGAVPRYKRYLDEMPGVALQDIWDDIRPIGSQANERLGYPTQKPLALLERVISFASNEGDTALDPFCGCGTALVAAQKLNRRWIGIDITHLAISVMRKRLQEHFPGIQVKVIGEPEDLPSAKALANQNRYQFQWWALSRIGARPLGEKKKGPDKGIDGVIPFSDEPSGKLKRAVVSVKSGKVGVPALRELIGVLKANQDPIGVFVTLYPPTSPMTTEASAVGFYHSDLWQRDYARVQILTIDEVFQGKQPDIPLPAPSPKADSFEKVVKHGKSIKGAILEKRLPLL